MASKIVLNDRAGLSFKLHPCIAYTFIQGKFKQIFEYQKNYLDQRRGDPTS